MYDIKRQASRMLAEEIISAIKKLTADNNKKYVNPQIQNYRFTLSNLSAEMQQDILNIAKNSSIDQDTLDQAVQDAIGNVQLNSSQIVDLDAKVAEITVLEVEKATIDTAQIEKLYATVADIIYLAAENAKVGDLEAQKITSAIADLGIANIGSADIGYAQIKDLETKTAIIRDGVGGKFYIDRLAVTDAQILSLTTGELVMQGSDGQLYIVFVDDDGNIQTQPRVISGDDIGAGAISGSNIADGTILGENIAENTITGALITEHGITARELNVSKIFADEALIRAIKASNIDVADLTANEAFIGTLVTSLIKAPNFGSEIDISNNSSIELTNQRISLIVTDESSESKIILTGQMAQAIADEILLVADKIDLSANESIQITVSKVVESELEAIQEYVASIDADLSITEGNIVGLTSKVEIVESDLGTLSMDLNETKAALTPDGLNVIVEQCKVIDDINDDLDHVEKSVAEVGITADKIYWLIEKDSSSASAIVLTQDAAKIISEAITLTAEKVNIVANDIDLSNNASIALIVGQAADDLESRMEGSYSEIMQRQDSIEATLVSKVDGEELRTYLRYTDGTVELGRSDSRYTSQTSDNGFVVLQDGSPMASIVQNTISAPVIESKRMITIGDFALRLGAKGHLILT